MATIITKFSSTPSSVPSNTDLVEGELAVNTADKRLYTEDNGNVIIELGTNPSSITTTNITASGTVTANTAFSGNLTGNVTGNVTGDLTGNVTGNVTAASGTTTLNNLSVGGSVTGTLNTADLAVTGNITVSGTVDGIDVSDAVVFSDTDLTSASWFLDEDTLSSNSATKAASQQSIKAYIDTTLVNIGAFISDGTPVANDFAVFVDGTTVGGKSYAEVRALLDLEVGTDVQAYDADTAKLDVVQTFTAAQTINSLTLGGTVSGADNTVQRINLQDYGEVTNAIGSIGGGTQDIDLTSGNVVSATVDTSTTTFTFSNPTASDEGCGFILFLTNGGSQTVNWPASVDWPAATAPTLTAAGVDILVFNTIDGGTRWFGNLVGEAYA